MAKITTIVGCGPGSAEYITPAAVQAVQNADLVLGPDKLVSLFDLPREKQVQPEKSPDQTLELIARLRHNHQVAVLVSGDPGCYSLGTLLVRRLGLENCRLIPGISSVQLAMARLGLAWTGASTLSIHGRPAGELDRIPELPCPLVILLGTDTATVLPWLDILLEKGTIYLMQNLGLKLENITRITCSQDLEPGRPGPALLVVV